MLANRRLFPIAKSIIINRSPGTNFNKWANSFSFSTTTSVQSSNVISTPQGVFHYLTHADLSSQQIYNLITLAIQHKYNVKYLNTKSGQPLLGKTLAIMFSKRSTRTRVATETAVTYLGSTIIMW